jgi:predicted dehydrogenase
MDKKIRWGIIGLGNIAHTFANDLLLSKNAVLVAVASRDINKARTFANQYKTHRFYGSYEDLAQDPGIDIVYIATPHPFHFENTMMCLQNGKSVLCEKPMGMNKEEVATMIREARERKLFLMEAMWTRFIPATLKWIDLLKKDSIGEIVYMKADFGFRAEFDPAGRLYNKQLGGGSLLDIGIYPIYLSLLTLGIPTSIKATARIAPSQVDTSCLMLFEYNNSSKAVLETTVEADTPTEAYIFGTKGTLKLHSDFFHCEKISLYQRGELIETFELTHKGSGYVHEIEEVNKCLSNHYTESPLLPHRVSFDLISIIDRVKDEIGLQYD